MTKTQRHKIAAFSEKATEAYRGTACGREHLLNAVLAMIDGDHAPIDVRFRAAILDYRHHYSKQS